MMGVTATALDNGYRLVIVLAGLKDDLRAQTARRFNTDLLLQSDPVPGLPGATTLGKPRGSTGKAKAYAPPYYVDCHDYAPLAAEIGRALTTGRPCVVVVKKHPTSLSDLNMVVSGIYADHGPENVPTLILDDECDEATVPGGEYEKAVPEGIIRLWGQTSPIPPVAYVGYTATAAANLLQNPDWVLYPDWTYLLRYPGGTNSSIQFAEPQSDNWYSGCDCYYSDFGTEPDEEDNFLVDTSVSPGDLALPVSGNSSLLDAFRAYFVSGAWRLLQDPERSFGNLNRLPAPHSMMIHTSAAQEDHSRWAAGLLEVYGGKANGDSYEFNADRLTEILKQEDRQWLAWHQRLARSSERLYESRPRSGVQRHPTWEQVKARLPEVFKETRLKVVNSDEGSGSFDFKPPLSAAGIPLRRPDIYLVAVGGSRLSRGITIEGLCISYFARWANFRHDDTVLQMSRWFGYRGRHLEFCRLFTTPSAYAGLREVAENDLQLRTQLASLMEQGKSPQDATLVFRASPYASPTAKTGSALTMDLTFSPFARVFSTIETGACSKTNEGLGLELVNRVRQKNVGLVQRQGGLERGFISRGWTAGEVADILDSWKFEKHNPRQENQLLRQYYRPMDTNRAAGDLLDPRWDPYQVAAYLRYWIAWAAQLRVSTPTFNVGVAFGELSAGQIPYDFPLLNRVVTAEDQVVGGWTGSSSNWRGDIVFDNPPPDLLDPRKNRLAGADGLLLLYVVHKDAVGKAGTGKKRTFHSPFFGISIPAGGPSFIRLLSATGAPLA
jgi:hypothetical protein